MNTTIKPVTPELINNVLNEYMYCMLQCQSLVVENLFLNREIFDSTVLLWKRQAHETLGYLEELRSIRKAQDELQS